MNDDTPLWRDLHALQTAMCFALELPAYYASPSWLNARTVLDVGTGHGDYLRGLVRRFPTKRYTGIDIEPGYVDAARAAAAGLDHVQFVVADVNDVEGRYDFAVLRLLLQHLDDPRSALIALRRATTPGGAALVIDALDGYRAFHPPLPHFMDFFEQYRQHERSAGRDRDVMDRLPTLASEAGWVVSASWDVLIPATYPGQLEVFRAVYSRVIDLIGPDVAHRCDVGGVRAEWAAWCQDDLAYAQVGLRIVRLDRA